ncbi:hypothetical protein JVU11DRAFT_2616 [Chiua virens]|nr:hypothetical protein JVU11DRAFT_2616 [Chiua virens]
MRAYQLNECKHPSQLTLVQDVPEPVPGPEDVIVDVYSAGLNFFDILQAQGKYQVKPPFPFILGAEFSGRIARTSHIPEGCPFRPGDRVFGHAQGAYADRIAVNANKLLPLPDNLTFDQGAGLSITWPTSYEAIVGRAQLKAGETILVNAAAGGVGIAAVQLSKALGATVIAAAGSPTKLDVCKRYGGADYVVNYRNRDWQKQVLEFTGGKGVDVVYDPVGWIRESLKCIAFKGRALVIGFANGPIENLPLNIVLLKNVNIMGVFWGNYANKEPSRVTVVWKELLELFASGKVKPVNYTTVYPLSNAMEGLRALEQRETWGKVVVRIRDEEKTAIAKL